ncbi:hypothetical protein B0H13DRAFT_2065538 [Mycena leptocephala]|nr:hypothetical protein B0H13DRAFT_2076209 [Mycena leptocephala]KAJ7867313.1 hypothetical protein B0H13DRAFT_2065538 [Mycena leptocephala]
MTTARARAPRVSAGRACTQWGRGRGSARRCSVSRLGAFLLFRASSTACVCDIHAGVSGSVLGVRRLHREDGDVDSVCVFPFPFLAMKFTLNCVLFSIRGGGSLQLKISSLHPPRNELPIALRVFQRCISEVRDLEGKIYYVDGALKNDLNSLRRAPTPIYF